jgi:hypothetical protein
MFILLWNFIKFTCNFNLYVILNKIKYGFI